VAAWLRSFLPTWLAGELPQAKRPAEALLAVA
jgi:hypothetical protein